MGTMIGNEAIIGGMDGWYAPSMNIHRTPFSGRNGEYIPRILTSPVLLHPIRFTVQQPRGYMLTSSTLPLTIRKITEATVTDSTDLQHGSMSSLQERST